MQIGNFIKTLFRNILLHKGFSLLTLLGLSLGIAMGLLVLTFVYFESSYDRHIPESELIYRLNSYGKIGEDTIHSALTPIPLAFEANTTEGIRNATRLMPGLSRVIENRHFRSLESNFFYTDSNFFKVFDLPFLIGSKQDFENDNNTAVITVSASQRLFGYNNPVGEILSIDNDIEYKIVGVIADLPINSHLKLDILANWGAVEQTINRENQAQQRSIDNNWLYLNSYTYYRISDNQLHSDIFNNLSLQASEKVNSQIEEAFGTDSSYPGSVSLKFGYISIHDINLFSDVNNELLPGTNPLYIKIFTGIAFFILLVTAINFMNLTTARSSRRFKEVAVRKIFFARRKDVIIQFLTEAVVYSFMALLIALVLVELFLPGFNRLFDIDMTAQGFIERHDLIWLILITLMVGMLAGSYPAIFYSGLSAIAIIKGSNKIKKAGILLRGLLVALQVGLSVLLISLTMVMYGQLSFLNKANHGFNSNNTIIIERGVASSDELREFKQQIVSTGIVSNAGIAQFIPGEEGSIISFRSTDEEEKVMLMATNYVDSSFFQTIDTKISYGRTFHAADTADMSKIVINESAARLMNFDPNNNNQIELVGGRAGAEIYIYNIIGVVNDIYFQSMKNPARPMVFIQNERNNMPGHIVAAIPENIGKNKLSKELNALWSQNFEGSVINYYPLKKVIENYYAEEKRFAGIGLMFSILAYLLAIMGQIGFAAFLLHYHQKNLYIKSILTASFQRNLFDTFKAFGVFILISIIVSIPLSIISVKSWLSGFHSVFAPSWFCWAIPTIITIITFCVITYVAGKREFNKRGGFLKTIDR